MNNLHVMTNERLNKLIDETQQTLVELKEEMSRREKMQQEHEITDLDHHMQNAEVSLTTIKNFIKFLMEDSKKR